MLRLELVASASRRNFHLLNNGFRSFHSFLLCLFDPAQLPNERVTTSEASPPGRLAESGISRALANSTATRRVKELHRVTLFLSLQGFHVQEV